LDGADQVEGGDGNNELYGGEGRDVINSTSDPAAR
jgi:hypothetical protein